MQSNERDLLFYMDALHKLANEVSRRTNVTEILSGILGIITGDVTKGIVLARYAEEITFELVAHENLDLQVIQETSRRLDTGVRNDLESTDDIIALAASARSVSESTNLSELMASVGMKTVIALNVHEKMIAYLGLGPLSLDTPFSENQIELLSTLITHTEIALENRLFCQDVLQENQQLKEALHKQFQFHNMIGQSDVMQKIYKRVQQIARYPNCSVLISGESGTGKELIARAIHHYSSGEDSNFVPINCAALPQDLVESELFGFEKGAFTGADRAKPGFFELADGGVLFLDEIAEMPLATQGKLLRAIETKEIMRVGGSDTQPVDVRIMAATNKDPREAIVNGQLRNDLFFRFDVEMRTPPLRNRREDIPLLANAFLEEFALENGLTSSTVSPQGLKVLMHYNWPGNIRELRRVLIQAVMSIESGIIRAEDIDIPHDAAEEIANAGLSLKESVERLKRMMIERALEDNDHNKTKAAKQLGISRQNLQSTMSRMNI